MTAKNRTFAVPAISLEGKSILVTGGTGTFGKAFVRHVLSTCRPRKLVVFSRDELKQSEFAQELLPAEHPSLRYFIGDVRDCDRLEMAMRGIDIVIHAAAMKHVPIAEYNPFECVRTNVHGAENIVMASLRSKVEKVIALSTDKAVNPINLYGASKLAADKIFIAANNLSGFGGPRFAVVRYGNVIGSRGSVLPYFRSLIAKGADHLPITDVEMSRFWITVEQGARFVLSSAAMMQGGEIFIPKIASMKVVELARSLAPKLPHKVIGIRPGEKLHEVLITEDDARSTYEMDDRFAIAPGLAEWSAEPLAAYGARRVRTGFRYASDTNDEWIDNASMRSMIDRMHG